MAVLLVAAIIGLLVGSALTALIHRMVAGGSWITGRSHCPRCHHVLMPRDLVPLFSFVVLHGQCRYCRGPISWFYPLVEGVTALLFVIAVLVRVGGVPAESAFDDQALQLLVLRDWAAIAVLLLLFGVDALASVLPDVVTLPAIVIFFTWNLFIGEQSVRSLLIGAAVGAGFFLAQYWISRGRWIGAGDIRFGALIGVLVGWPATLIALLAAYVAGAAVGVTLVARGSKSWKSHIPFGTFLSFGTLIALFFGEYIFGWYTTNFF